MIPPVFSSALPGLRASVQRVNRAAEVVASAGIAESAAPPTATTGAPVAPGDLMDLTEAMAVIMLAQRAYVAQIRVIQAADEMGRESARLGGDDRT